MYRKRNETRNVLNPKMGQAAPNLSREVITGAGVEAGQKALPRAERNLYSRWIDR